MSSSSIAVYGAGEHEVCVWGGGEVRLGSALAQLLLSNCVFPPD